MNNSLRNPWQTLHKNHIHMNYHRYEPCVDTIWYETREVITKWYEPICDNNASPETITHGRSIVSDKWFIIISYLLRSIGFPHAQMSRGTRVWVPYCIRESRASSCPIGIIKCILFLCWFWHLSLIDVRCIYAFYVPSQSLQSLVWVRSVFHDKFHVSWGSRAYFDMNLPQSLAGT